MDRNKHQVVLTTYNFYIAGNKSLVEYPHKVYWETWDQQSKLMQTLENTSWEKNKGKQIKLTFLYRPPHIVSSVRPLVCTVTHLLAMCNSPSYLHMKQTHHSFSKKERERPANHPIRASLD